MILGITGGIGSGKTTILKYLEDKYSALIIEADAIAKQIMLPGNACYNKILNNFSELELNEDKTINTKSMSKIVFYNPHKLQELNNIVHPAVKDKIKSIIKEQLEKDSDRLIVIEAALLLQDGYDKICDRIWYIHCKKSLRIERLIKGRNYTKERALEVINNQMSEDEYRSLTDEFIDNSFDEANSFRQMDILLEKVYNK